MTASEIQQHLRGLSSPEGVAMAARFFKTGPGQYGEGDILLGLRDEVMHRLSKPAAARAPRQRTGRSELDCHKGPTTRAKAATVANRRCFGPRAPSEQLPWTGNHAGKLPDD
jgi:hypothetical protein